MDIMELGAIGELVGGVAVIASLIYVGIQVRQGTEQTRQTNAIERARANREVVRESNQILIANCDPDLMTAYRKMLVEYDSVTNNEKSILHNQFLVPMGTHVLSTVLAAREGLVDEALAERFTAYWVSIVRCPGIHAWWERAKGALPFEFTHEIDTLLAASGLPSAITETQPWLVLDDSESA